MQEIVVEVARLLDRRVGALQRHVHGVQDSGDGGLLVGPWERN